MQDMQELSTFEVLMHDDDAYTDDDAMTPPDDFPPYDNDDNKDWRPRILYLQNAQVFAFSQKVIILAWASSSSNQ